VTLATLPDDAPCYVPGYGETTVGEVRASMVPDCDPEEVTLRMWEDIATRNLLREPWELGVSQSDIRAYHGSRCSSDPTPRASS